MSAGMGYFRIEFYTENGSADAEAAKRAYNWCREQYDWFKGKKGDGSDAPFLLEENKFTPNPEVCIDGDEALDIENSGVPAGLKWLGESCKQAKAARLVASLLEDFSESSYDSNSYTELAWINGELKDRYFLQFNSSEHPCYKKDSSVLVYYDDTYSYSYRQVGGVFKNTKTGETVLTGRLLSRVDNFSYLEDESFDDGEDFGKFLIFDDYSGEEADIGDKEALVKAFVAELKASYEFRDNAPESISESDWTFEGLDSEGTFFDRYGSNPPLKKYKDIDELKFDAS